MYCSLPAAWDWGHAPAWGQSCASALGMSAALAASARPPHWVYMSTGRKQAGQVPWGHKGRDWGQLWLGGDDGSLQATLSQQWLLCGFALVLPGHQV